MFVAREFYIKPYPLSRRKSDCRSVDTYYVLDTGETADGEKRVKRNGRQMSKTFLEFQTERAISTFFIRIGIKFCRLGAKPFVCLI